VAGFAPPNRPGDCELGRKFSQRWGGFVGGADAVKGAPPVFGEGGLIRGPGGGVGRGRAGGAGEKPQRFLKESQKKGPFAAWGRDPGPGLGGGAKEGAPLFFSI